MAVRASIVPNINNDYIPTAGEYVKLIGNCTEDLLYTIAKVVHVDGKYVELELADGTLTRGSAGSLEHVSFDVYPEDKPVYEIIGELTAGLAYSARHVNLSL